MYSCSICDNPLHLQQIYSVAPLKVVGLRLPLRKRPAAPASAASPPSRRHMRLARVRDAPPAAAISPNVLYELGNFMGVKISTNAHPRESIAAVTSLTDVVLNARLVNARVGALSSPLSGVGHCSTPLKISPWIPRDASCAAAGRRSLSSLKSSTSSNIRSATASASSARTIS